MIAIEIDGYCVGEYVSDFLAYCDISVVEAAAKIDGDIRANYLWLEMIQSIPVWENNNIKLSDDEAKNLSKIFGNSEQLWKNIDATWQNWKQKHSEQREPKC
jgi:hypothetical protein